MLLCPAFEGSDIVSASGDAHKKLRADRWVGSIEQSRLLADL